MNLRILYLSTSALLFTVSLFAYPESALAAPKAQNICLNSATGALTSRTRCSRAETVLSLSSLIARVNEQQGVASSSLCLNTATGTLAAKSACDKSETALSLASLTSQVTDQQVGSSLCFNAATGALASRSSCGQSETALSLTSLTTQVTNQQAVAGSSLCLDSSTGTLVSRSACGQSEVALSLTSLTSKVTEQQGTPPSPFSVSFSPGFDSDVTIPAGFQPPGFLPFSPGTLQLTATCPRGLVHASACETTTMTGVSLTSSGTTVDGKSARCFWNNLTTQPKSGRFFVKVVCGEF